MNCVFFTYPVIKLNADEAQVIPYCAEQFFIRSLPASFGGLLFSNLFYCFFVRQILRPLHEFADNVIIDFSADFVGNNIDFFAGHNVLNVVPPVAVRRNFPACHTRPHGLAQQLHLPARIVDIKFPLNPVSGKLKYVAQHIPHNRAARVPEMKRAGGVCAHELKQHILAPLGRRAETLSPLLYLRQS